MTFEAPAWLWLALLGVPAGALAIRLLAAMTLVRRWSAALARAALIALITITLAGASSVRQTNRLAVVAVIDVSGSVRRFAPVGTDESGRPISAIERARAWVAQSSAQRGPDDLLGIVIFDGQALAVAAPTAGNPLDRPFEPSGVEGSDIGAAVRLARAMIPADAAGRIVLISDGNQTSGDAHSAVREASSPRGSRGPTPIDTVPVEYALVRETFIESLDSPPSAPDQAAITLRIVMVATAPSRGLLRVLADGEPIDASPGRPGDGLPLSLEPGRTVVAVPVTLPPGRTHRFLAIYEPERIEQPDGSVVLSGDTDIANNRAEAFTVTPGRGSVLVLDGDGQGNPAGAGATLAEVWRAAGLDVVLAAPEAMPKDMLSLQAHDLVVLQNIPADALGPEGQSLLRSYVRDMGGGLLTLGGRESYGAGGWKGSAIEDLIPVSLDLPERLLSPELAVVFVMDRSGSMGWTVRGTSRSQQSIANESAAAAVRALDPADMVGVITFNLEHQVVVPLAPNTDPEATARRIMQIFPDGGTAAGAAMLEAHRQLRSVEAKARHVIVLSDGIAMDAGVLPDIARSMREDGITVSTIVIGDGAHADSMRSVAYHGGGTFYEVVNPSILPRVFLRAVRIMRTPMVRETPFTPSLTPAASPLTAGLPRELPPLLGVNLTQPRAEQAAVNAIVTPEGEPVLAHWQVELGQVVSFTSDAWRWGQPWLDWDGYRTLWTQVARLTARPAAPRGLDLAASHDGDRLRIRLGALDDTGRALDLLSVDATVFAPDGTTREIRLPQVGPGLYEASLPADRSGAWVVIAKPRRGAERMAPVVAGVSLPDAMEFRRLESDRAILEQIAGIGGGRVLSLDAPVALFDRRGIEPLSASTPLWPVLVAWTIAVLMLDVGTRRIAWDRLVSRELRGRSVLDSIAEASRDRGQQAAATLSGLAASRSSARADSDAALTQRDAAATARRAQESQRAERVAAARATMLAGAEPSVRAEPIAATTAAPPEDESPLMRAKRRARERLDEKGA